MSLDYPNRKVWLAIRGTTKRPGRCIHVSGYGLAARRSMLPGVPAGLTYQVGRNRWKRARRARKVS